MQITFIVFFLNMLEDSVNIERTSSDVELGKRPINFLSAMTILKLSVTCKLSWCIGAAVLSSVRCTSSPLGYLKSFATHMHYHSNDLVDHSKRRNEPWLQKLNLLK